ncbi:hypothetical protein [Hydrogenophaga sp.]|nr:hypothetical protein [Hydrogenophaga sp.]
MTSFASTLRVPTAPSLFQAGMVLRARMAMGSAGLRQPAAHS